MQYTLADRDLNSYLVENIQLLIGTGIIINWIASPELSYPRNSFNKATEAGCFTVNRIQGQVPLTESRSLLYC
ncbi:hypothetical protein Avbf_14033 [Armadillidium vulgare]|nr:hypothetical protein Avbf_14033 [Armadillidium vulgare]